MDQQSFHCITCCCILGLCIDNNRNRFIWIIISIYINMTDSICMSHNRNLCMIHNILNETVRSSRYQKVNRLMTRQKFINLTVLLCLKHTICRQPCIYYTIMYNLKQDTIGICCLPTTL